MLSPLQIVLYQSALDAGWVLLPMAPAFLAYWVSPSAPIAASGRLSAITFKTSGAFAAYLITFFACSGLINTQNNNISSLLHSSWTISGRYQIVDGAGNDVTSSSEPTGEMYVKLPIEHIGGNFFEISVPDHGGNPPPMVDMYYGALGPVGINPISGVKRNELQKQIELSSAVVIPTAPIHAIGTLSGGH